MELFMTVLRSRGEQVAQQRHSPSGDWRHCPLPASGCRPKSPKAEAPDRQQSGIDPQYRRQLWRSVGHRPGGPDLARAVAAGELDAEAVDEAALGRHVCMADLPPWIC